MQIGGCRDGQASINALHEDVEEKVEVEMDVQVQGSNVRSEAPMLGCSTKSNDI